MTKLNILEKLIFGLALLLLALVAFAEIFPALWEILPSMEKEATFSGTDIAMIGLTFGVVFFAGTQAFLQWRHHKFERKIRKTDHNWKLFGPRTMIYDKSMHIFMPNSARRKLLPEYSREFLSIVARDGHCLPMDVREIVFGVVAKSSEYVGLLRMLEKYEQLKLAVETEPVYEHAYTGCLKEIERLEDWFDDNFSEFVGKYLPLLQVLEEF